MEFSQWVVIEEATALLKLFENDNNEEATKKAVSVVDLVTSSMMPYITRLPNPEITFWLKVKNYLDPSFKLPTFNLDDIAILDK